MLTELVDVDTVKPGDEILVSRKIGLRVVSDVMAFGYERVVWYFSETEPSFENKARDKSGANYRRRLCEKMLIAVLAGENVNVRRGRRETADRLRNRMDAEFSARIARRFE